MKPYISLAPMEGITTYIYRNAINKFYRNIDEYYSPFLTSQVLSFKEEADVLPDNNKGINLVPQILTNNPETFKLIETRLKDFGYKTINLNLGCPSGTMVSKGRGAGQLKDLEKLEKFLDAIYSDSDMNISIKTRIGMFFYDEWEDILQVYNKFPVSRLIIHPRVQKDFYNGIPHVEAFIQAKEYLSCPVTYNGDIVSTQSFYDLNTRIPDINNIMIGRGMIANPTLAQQIKKEETVEKDIKIFSDFHNEILDGYINYMSGDQPVLYKMKELWTFMRNYLSLTDKDMKAIKKCNTVREYKILMSRLVK